MPESTFESTIDCQNDKNYKCFYGGQKKRLDIRKAFSSIINSSKALLMQVIDTPSQHQIQVALLNREL